jgi:DNA-binding CsgD family transcriptional regulator
MDRTFVGRRTELAMLRRGLDEASQGYPEIIVMEGPAGIGKTALLTEFLEGVDRRRILRASGEELEQDLPFGIAEQLFTEASASLPDWLDGPEQVAGTSDLIRIGGAIAELLGRRQADGVVVLAVDDIHWGDAVSLQALALGLRRLRDDKVLTLLSMRDGAVEGLPGGLQRLVTGARGARLRLTGLHHREIRALGAAMGVGWLSGRAAARLHHHTGGNPLHARTLLEELPGDSFQNIGQPLPAPRSFRLLVLGRLATCHPSTRDLVMAASVFGTRCPLELARRLAQIDDPLPALDQAIAARLLEERPTATERLVAFPHPLVQSAIYHDLGPVRRAALHARAAMLAEDERAMLRHSIAAAQGTDPSLAAKVADLADRQAATGSWLPAADNLLAAARLSAVRVTRERFALQAIEHLLLAGSTSEAATIARSISTFAAGSRRDYILGRLALVEGRQADARARLSAAWDRRGVAGEGELTAAIAEQLALLELTQLNGEEATVWARRALEAAPAGAAVPSNRLDILAIALAISGKPAEALAVTASLPTVPAVAGPERLDGLVGRGAVRLWTDDLPSARRDLALAAAAYRQRRGPLPFGPLALAFLAESEYRLGAWDDAIAHAKLAVSTSIDADQSWPVAISSAIAAFALAGRGALETAEAHLRLARTFLRSLDAATATAYVATAEAVVASVADDQRGVVAALRPLTAINQSGLTEPGLLPWRELYVEALARLGAYATAESVLQDLEVSAARRARRSSLAGAARARGNLEAARGRPDLAEAAFVDGLDQLAVLPMPFDRGLLETAYGRLLRRVGRRAAAVAQLEAARAEFARLNARLLLDRCDQELRACGRTSAKRRTRPISRLTPQELAVSRLVASGMTNRQAADNLVVSIKTVEFHLRNAFSKLEVESRTQLALRLRQQEAARSRADERAHPSRRFWEPDAEQELPWRRLLPH